MNRKSELKMQYKEQKTEAGIYQIKNTQNQKVFIESTRNLKTINGRHFALNTGGHPNKALQKEWKEFGPDAFVIEVLEVLKQKDDPFYDLPGELEKLKDKWLHDLQPYGERGYNDPREEKRP